MVLFVLVLFFHGLLVDEVRELQVIRIGVPSFLRDELLIFPVKVCLRIIRTLIPFKRLLL